jgi:hypothetical protein
MTLVGIDGRTILRKELPVILSRPELEFNLETGIYFIILSDGNSSGVGKFVVDE